VETSSKERLTGALLVVLALVILVPELLSGHREAESGTRPAQNPEEGAPLQTYDVQLDGSKVSPAVPREVPAATAGEVAAVPPPVTGTETPSVPSESRMAALDAFPAVKPVEQSAAGANSQQPAKPVSAAAQPRETSASVGKWWVQVGVFASRDNAQQLARQLRAAGFTIDVSQGRAKGKELYRVRAGPAADRAAASDLQARLARAGQENPSLVPP
jgi:DedD protein